MSPKDAVAQWIHYWGNGGGCYSLESHINDSVLEGVLDDASFEDIEKRLLDFAPEFPCADACAGDTDSSYAALVKVAIKGAKEDIEKRSEHGV